MQRSFSDIACFSLSVVTDGGSGLLRPRPTLPFQPHLPVASRSAAPSRLLGDPHSVSKPHGPAIGPLLPLSGNHPSDGLWSSKPGNWASCVLPTTRLCPLQPLAWQPALHLPAPSSPVSGDLTSLKPCWRFKLSIPLSHLTLPTPGSSSPSAQEWPGLTSSCMTVRVGL